MVRNLNDVFQFRFCTSAHPFIGAGHCFLEAIVFDDIGAVCRQKLTDALKSHVECIANF